MQQDQHLDGLEYERATRRHDTMVFLAIKVPTLVAVLIFDASAAHDHAYVAATVFLLAIGYAGNETLRLKAP